MRARLGDLHVDETPDQRTRTGEVDPAVVLGATGEFRGVAPGRPLYQHPLHDARRARGLPPVNSFWLHGTGDGVAATKPAEPTEPTEPTEPLIVIDELREASLAQDGAGWLAAWASIESRHLASVPPAQLMLCGERRARVFAPAPNRWWQRLAAPLRPGASAPSLHAMLSSL